MSDAAPAYGTRALGVGTWLDFAAGVEARNGIRNRRIGKNKWVVRPTIGAGGEEGNGSA